MRTIAMLLCLGMTHMAVAQKVTLRFNPPAGATYRYSVTTLQKMSGPQASDSKTTMSSTMKVLKNTGGVVSVSQSISGAKVTGTGPMASSMTMTVDHMGRPIKGNASGDPVASSMLNGMAAGMGGLTTFPKEPVGVGSKWSSEMDVSKMKMMPGMKMGGKLPVKMTLKRFESRAGKRCAVVEIVTSGTMTMSMGQSGAGSGSSRIHSVATLWLEVATGVPIEMTTKADNLTTIGAMKMAQSTTTTMKLKS
jgi:hypothetical protein